jgi:hypothetical protein
MGGDGLGLRTGVRGRNSVGAEDRGAVAGELLEVDPLTATELNQVIQIPQGGASIAVHLRDAHGRDRGVLGEGKITKQKFTP